MPVTTPIPFNKPSLHGGELDYVLQAVANGHTSAKGALTDEVASILTAEHCAADVLLTTSCTDALEMAALLLDLGPGDKVIVPSFTFVTTALAFARTGASLVFADIDEDTLGMSPQSVAELMDPWVRAVVPVHYAGIACRIDELTELVGMDTGVDIVEDNAHGLFGELNGSRLGTFGRFSALSFHETKNFSAGEGGALVVNREADVDRAHTVLDKGTDRRQFLRGQVDKYSWRDVGSSFGLSDMLAGFLLAQLEHRTTILAERRRVFDRYMAALAPLAGELGYRVPWVPADRTPAYHMFYLVLEDRDTRDALIAELGRRHIQATFHYVPLHDADGAKAYRDRETQCPVTDSISERIVRLPFFTSMRDADVDRVVDAVVDALR